MHISNLIKHLKKGNNFNTLDGHGNAYEPIRLVNLAFAYAFSMAILSTSGGEKIDVNKNFGVVSTIMRLLITLRKNG